MKENLTELQNSKGLCDQNVHMPQKPTKTWKAFSICLFVKHIKKRKRRKWTGLVWQFISCHRVSDMLENTTQSKLCVQALLSSRLTFNDYLSTPRLSWTLQAHPAESLIPLTPRALVPIPSHPIPSTPEALYSCPPIDFPRHAPVALVCLTPLLYFPRLLSALPFPTIVSQMAFFGSAFHVPSLVSHREKGERRQR